MFRDDVGPESDVDVSLLAVMFAFVVVVAGGAREKLQRGFQLHRLTGHVCGRWPALAVTSVAFGLGHMLQGFDVAVATAALGAPPTRWWRRSGSTPNPPVLRAPEVDPIVALRER